MYEIMDKNTYLISQDFIFNIDIFQEVLLGDACNIR